MKPLCLFVVALATTAITLFSSFSPAAGEHSTKVEPACITAAKASASMSAFFDAHFYWFTLPFDTYDGFNSMFEEIVRMQTVYGVPCDGSISGGTLVARGYILPTVPHIIGPFAFVYAHF